MALLHLTFESTFVIYFYTTLSGLTWYDGSEISRALGYTKHNIALNGNVDLNDRTEWSALCSTNPIKAKDNFTSDALFINEAGVYAMIHYSKSHSTNREKSSRFKQWFQGTLLPAARDNVRSLQIDDYVHSLNLKAQFEIFEDVKLDGWVYVATNSILQGRKLYKIGSTTNVDERLYRLNETGVDDWFTIYRSFNSDRQRVELKMRETLKAYKKKRDFFEFENIQAAIGLVNEAFCTTKDCAQCVKECRDAL